jgi:hypothetical protein
MIALLTDAARSYRFDVRQFHRMLTTGVFTDQKVELVAGRVFPMTKRPPHIFAVESLHDLLRPILPADRWTIREEKPISFSRFWEPLPDIAVLRGHKSLHNARLPRPGDVALLAEVSDTTYHRDRGPKWRRYAAAGIPVYVIVRLKGADTVVEVWTGPAGKGKAARYADAVRYAARAGESFPVELDGQTFGQVAVADLIAP